MRDEIIDSLINTNELNRLQRCAKNKDKKEILKWAQDLERRLAELYCEKFKNIYLEQYENRLKDIDTALLFTLHFGESTKFGNKRLKETMNDLIETTKGFYNGDYDRTEYRKMLKADGIRIEEYI